jgi:general stress protein 26
MILACTLAGSSPREVAAQTALSRDALLAAARAIMVEARYCSLITLDASGAPQVRTMDPFPPEDEVAVWMGTHRATRKVREIAADPRVALHYSLPETGRYVSIVGTARIVEDEEAKAARWKEEWERLYEDPASDYVLIEVIPVRLEIVDFPGGIMGDPSTWEPASVVFR